MKGLELCEKYYFEFGTGMIKEKFSDFQDKIAAGLIGDGSECYGFDDEISRDHDWGPGFYFFLEKEDFKKIGDALQFEYERLPTKYHGFERIASQWGKGRVGVVEIGAYYQKYLGIPHTPEKFERWFTIPEEYLSACTAGKIFFDPLGKFTKIRNELLSFYPDDVRLARIAARCMSCGQSGQYNFMRSIRRNEYFASQYSETKFCSDIISLVFLLNRQYTPYYKWRHRAVRNLPIMGNFLYSRILDIVMSSDHKTKINIIEEICTEVIKEFHEKGLSNLDSDSLIDHGPVIHEKIKNSNLRKRNVWVG